MNYKLIIPTAAIIVLSSCGTSARIKSADSQEIDRTSIMQTPTLADINVSTVKISGNYSGVHNTKAPAASIDFAKNMAMADAIEKAKCDFIVHPLFDIQINSNAIQVSVNGYPANYKSFKPLTAADTSLLFAINRFNIVSGGSINTSKKTNAINIDKKGTTGKAILGILGSVGLVAILVALAAG